MRWLGTEAGARGLGAEWISDQPAAFNDKLIAQMPLPQLQERTTDIDRSGAGTGTLLNGSEMHENNAGFGPSFDT